MTMTLTPLSFLLTLISAVVALGLAAYVLRCNWQAFVNRWIALGFFVIAIYQSLALASSLVGSDAAQLALLRAAFGVLAAIPPVWLGFSFAFGERHNGPRASRWYCILPCAALAAFGTTIPLFFGRGIHAITVKGAGNFLAALDNWGKLLFSVYLVGFVLVLVNVENLYRNAAPPERHRLRLLTLGIFVAGACQIVGASHTLLFAFVHPSLPLLSASGFLGAEALMAFAVVRHRLLDSDVYVSRYVIYRSLTLLLVGGYLVTLGIAAEILPRFNIRLDFLTGSLFAIGGGAALALLLLSETVRWKVKTFIQAHFYQHKYDYRREWMELTRHLSHATTAPMVAAQTADRILKIMWVRQVGIYATGDQPGSMHLLHHTGYPHLPSSISLEPDAVQALSSVGARIPSAGRMEDALTEGNELLAGLFPDTPVGHLVPLVALDTLVGLLVVGPEMSGKPFGVDDKDLLAAIASQVGAMLVNARLAQEAAEGRGLQAFARLSAFIAHDLKNSVGMLSLLAENAPGHMHQPEFQADAVRTLAEVTERMERLLATLRTSDQHPAESATRISLASALGTLLRAFKSQIPPRIVLESRLEPTPDISMSMEQLRTVLANLIMNAVDAISSEGRITVETRGDENWAILTVADTGPGMSADFVRDRLFRPLQTTKPRGLGIGLYQCRSIVRALGGDLTVESQEGVGTRMTVRLPAASRQEEQQAAGSRQLAEG